jgi:hypothetical protein
MADRIAPHAATRFGSFLGELHPLLDLLAWTRAKQPQGLQRRGHLAHQSLNPVQQTFFAFSTRRRTMTAEKTPR